MTREQLEKRLDRWDREMCVPSYRSVGATEKYRDHFTWTVEQYQRTLDRLLALKERKVPA